MTRFMLDTNTASSLLKGEPNVVARVAGTPPELICISAVTSGEILHGVAKRPEATKLRATVNELLSAIETLPWTSATAQRYANNSCRTRAARKAAWRARPHDRGSRDGA